MKLHRALTRVGVVAFGVGAAACGKPPQQPQMPLAEVVRMLRQAYDVPADTFGLDVAAFVDQLVQAALVEPVPG